MDEHDTRNRYWVLRHGESIANTTGRIVSRPTSEALVTCGLTERGRAQVEHTVRGSRPSGPVLVVASDFARAVQTAEIATTVWGASTALLDQRLRERDFGRLDGGDVSGYEQVWAADAVHDRLDDVETVGDVLARVVDLTDDLEERSDGQDVVLVAHGDVLQIAQSWFAGIDPARHRTLPHLANAELRALGLRP